MSLSIFKEERSLARELLFFFFPPHCVLCSEAGHRPLCPSCHARLSQAWSPRRYLTQGGTGFADAFLTLFSYQDPSVRRLIYDWKKENWQDLPLIFAPFVEKGARAGLFPRELDRIVYLPRRPAARREAGFDQAEAIACMLSDVLHLPSEALLTRRGGGTLQRAAYGEAREQNVRGVFSSTRPLQGESILLVDDVLTTGATAREGARALKAAGAMHVFVFSLAH